MVDPVQNNGSASTELLRLAGIEKAFGEEQVLPPLDLEIGRGEFFTLLGPSGCGKTTLLRLVSGFERPDAGRILLNGRDLTDEPPERRPFNMVFQSYALFPHMSVAENVAYGLHLKCVPKAEINARIESMLALVHLQGATDRSVTQLSGGERQRVALARALVNEPEVLLLDEPLGALDLKLRKQLQSELREIQRRLGTTFVYVTHDQEEALILSDRIAVMDAGRLAQVGDPREIYERPKSRFAAEFIGEISLIECRLTRLAGTEATVALPGGAHAQVSYFGSEPLEVGNAVLLAVRPEHWELEREGPGHLAGKVSQTTFLGTHCLHRIELSSGGEVTVTTSSDQSHPTASPAELNLRRGCGAVVAG